jgi:hypothetical protein
VHTFQEADCSDLKTGPQWRRAEFGLHWPPGFLFRCSTTGLQVQGLVADDATEEANAFVTVACTARSSSHFVNAVTGKVLGRNAADDRNKTGRAAPDGTAPLFRFY